MPFIRSSFARARALGLVAAAVWGACSSSASAQCGFALGTPVSTFNPQGTSPLQAFGDFNADGLLDHLVIGPGTAVTARLNVGGAGVFSPTPIFGGGFPNPRGVAIADFNGDGRADVAIADDLFGANVTYAQPGNTFSAAVALSTPFAGFAVVTGDFNQDGLADIVVADLGGGRILTWLGTGGGPASPNAGFSAPVVTPLGGPQPNALAVADVNGDGKLDVVALSSAGQVIVLLNLSGNGVFTGGGTYASPAASPNGIAVGDVDADGLPDIVLTSGTSPLLAIMRNQGAGTFGGSAALFSLPATGASPVIADVNADGLTDVVVTVGSSSGSVLLRNPATGFFTAAQAVAIGTGTITSVRIADLNADGRMDLVTESAAGATSVMLNVTNNAAVVTVPPLRQVVMPARTASFSVTATGTTLAYRWRKNGVNLNDGPGVGGATTPNLTLVDIPFSDDLSVIDCLITNPCAVVRTNPVAMGFGPMGCQPADIAYDDGTPLPPFGMPGVSSNNGVNEGDYNLFFQRFFEGCI